MRDGKLSFLNVFMEKVKKQQLKLLGWEERKLHRSPVALKAFAVPASFV